jgi:hypothetical protein
MFCAPRKTSPRKKKKYPAAAGNKQISERPNMESLFMRLTTKVLPAVALRERLPAIQYC